MSAHRRYLAVFTLAVSLFAAPALTLNVIVDPYGVRAGWHPELGQDEIAKSDNYRLFALSRYAHNSRPNVFLGDSRSLKFTEQLLGPAWANLSYGGASVFEQFSTFWFATRSTRLRTVVLTIPFSTFSDSYRLNLVPEAEAMLDEPLRYYAGWSTLRTSMRSVAAMWPNTVSSEAPPMSRDEFWDYQLNTATDALYSRWEQPTTLLRELNKVVAHCRRNGISLFILLPPAHESLRNLTVRYHLDDEYAQYKRTLSNFGVPVMDFDLPNAFTRNRANFNDPYHVVDSAISEIVSAMRDRGLPVR